MYLNLVFFLTSLNGCFISGMNAIAGFKRSKNLGILFQKNKELIFFFFIFYKFASHEKKKKIMCDYVDKIRCSNKKIITNQNKKKIIQISKKKVDCCKSVWVDLSSQSNKNSKKNNKNVKIRIQ